MAKAGGLNRRKEESKTNGSGNARYFGDGNGRELARK